MTDQTTGTEPTTLELSGDIVATVEDDLVLIDQGEDWVAISKDNLARICQAAFASDEEGN